MKKNMLFTLSTLVLAALVLAACAPANLPVNGQVLTAAQNTVTTQVAIVNGEFTGMISSITPDQWIIAGNPVQVTTQTVIDNGLAVGVDARVHANVDSTGAIVASKIETEQSGGQDDSQQTLAVTPGINGDELFGVVETMSTNSWTVSGQVIALTAQTEIKNSIKVGDMVKVHVLRDAGGNLTAREIELATASQGTQTPQSGNLDDSNKAGEMEFFGTVQVMDAGVWTVSGSKFIITAATEVKDVISVGDNVKVHALVGADGTLLAREIELSAAPILGGAGSLEFTGVIESVLPGGGWTIGGQTVRVNSQTEIKGTFVVGDKVKVEGSFNADGTLMAREIKNFDASSSSGSDTGSSNNSSGSGLNSGSSTSGPDDSPGGSGGIDDGSGHN